MCTCCTGGKRFEALLVLLLLRSCAECAAAANADVEAEEEDVTSAAKLDGGDAVAANAGAASGN